MRKEAVKSRSPNVYDRKCLPLSNKEIESKLRSGASYTGLVLSTVFHTDSVIIPGLC